MSSLMNERQEAQAVIGNLREELAKAGHSIEELSFLLECSKKEISELN